MVAEVIEILLLAVTVSLFMRLTWVTYPR